MTTQLKDCNTRVCYSSTPHQASWHRYHQLPSLACLWGVDFQEHTQANVQTIDDGNVK
jgi:hypothetical protein